MKHLIEFSRRLNDADARFYYLGERRDCNVAMVMVLVLEGSVSLPALVEEFVPDEGGIPRFADYLRRAPLGLARPVWTPLPAEERVVERYGRQLELPPGAGWEDVLAVVDEIQSTPFHPERAPWEVAVIDGAPDGRTALVMKVHHGLSDGLAIAMLFVRTFAADVLADAGMAIEVETEPPLRGSPLRIALRDRAAALRRWLGLLARSLPELAKNAESRRRELEAMRLAVRALRGWAPPAPGRFRRLAAFRVPTTTWIAAAESRGGGSNELFLALAARITRQLRDRDDPGAGPVRVGMPVTTRVGGANEGGNSMMLCVVELTGAEGELADLASVRERAREARAAMRSDSPSLFEATLEFLSGSLWAAYDFRQGATFDVVATNIPVAVKGEILEVPVEEIILVAPAIGQSLSCSLTTYGDHFFFAANADRGLVPGPTSDLIEETLTELFGEDWRSFGVGDAAPAADAPEASAETGAIRWDQTLKKL